ncbi:hypothetical protein [Clostridium sp. Marseille-P2415]|uniref:hypothetical protein n=1 Tax=Clostridium sp. Marseille-P2415 TaxID=1805471 RepID=UPI0013562C57|nr:hypothetical protein [Clostridium sp. Marseille-P2415]
MNKARCRLLEQDSKGSCSILAESGSEADCEYPLDYLNLFLSILAQWGSCAKGILKM